MHMLHALRDACRQRGQNFIYIDGSTPTIRRQPLVDSFNTDPELRFAIMSISACGVGLNITGASHVIFAELLWCDKMMVQAEDRVHRSGQESPVVIEYLLVKHSIDEVMLNKINKKYAQSRITVDNMSPDAFIP